jgi:hypothetical protein
VAEREWAEREGGLIPRGRTPDAVVNNHRAAVVLDRAVRLGTCLVDILGKHLVDWWTNVL